MRLALFLAAVLFVQSPDTPEWPTKGWRLSTPQAAVLDAGVLAVLDSDIAAGKYGFLDSVLIIRHGRIAYERTYKHDYDRIYGEHARKPSPLNATDPSGPYNYFNSWWHPFYRRQDLHTLQSVTKTVTSIVIGIALARNEFPALDTPVLNFFDPHRVANVDDRKRRMTIRHLLTMTAGLDWNEDLPYADPNNSAIVMEASVDWVRFAIDRRMADEPGAIFKYNSGATQLLSHIFRVATGRDIEDYAGQHLFAPLGVVRHFWKRTPTGLIDTEGGLYLHPHDVAKIGYLFLRNGAWEGRTIVRPEWVAASIAPSADVGNGVKYGFKWWLMPYGTDGRFAWTGNGFGDQRLIVVPEHDLVAVFTGWNILPGRPNLSRRVAVDRILEAVVRRTTKPPDIFFVPTRHTVADAMLSLADVGPSDLVYDLGSGDGRIVILAAQKYGARGVGVEIDPKLVEISRQVAREGGVADRVRFIEGDLFTTDISGATVVTLYLSTRINQRLEAKLKRELRPGSRIVSHQFGIGRWSPAEIVRAEDGTDLLLWKIPAR